MKKIILLSSVIILFTLFFWSCQNEDLSDENPNAIAKIVNEKTQFTVDKSLVKMQWESELKTEIDNINFDEVKIIKIDDNYYLRGYSKDYISTKLLVLQGKLLAPSGTTCTSKACATSSTACMPQKDGSCSACWFGDCTRTTSSD